MRVVPTARRILPILIVATAALAADQQILGRKLLIKDSSGVEARRVVIVQAKERPTSLTLVGDPTAGGAILQIVANGATGSTQVLTLDATGWTATASGFTYTGATTGDPVRRVFIKRTSSGTSVLKAVLKGNMGIADLVVTPPNPGDDGGLVLALAGGDRYCVSLGGGAGGIEKRDDAGQWNVANATAKPGCPFSASITTTTSSTSTSSTVPTPCTFDGPACNGACPSGYTCQSEGGSVPCFCVAGSSNLCQSCDPPCTGGQVCTAALGGVTPLQQYLVACGCVEPPACEASAGCGGNCPPGSSCQGGGSQTTCACYSF